MSHYDASRPTIDADDRPSLSDLVDESVRPARHPSRGPRPQLSEQPADFDLLAELNKIGA
jgi:hypothetical protein